MSNIITAEHITKRFSAHTALDDVSIEIPRGSVYGLLGPNGAGKTTLIRCINRIILPDEGNILFDGRPITQKDVYRIGYLPEERGLYRKMKVGEQALFLAKLKGLSHHEALVRLKEWFERCGIEEWWNRKVEELSKGKCHPLEGGDLTPTRRGCYGDILNTQYVVSRGDLRPYHPYKQVAQHPLGQGR